VALRNTGVDDGHRHVLTCDPHLPDLVGANHFGEVDDGVSATPGNLDSFIAVNGGNTAVSLYGRHLLSRDLGGHSVDDCQVFVNDTPVTFHHLSSHPCTIGLHDDR